MVPPTSQLRSALISRMSEVVVHVESPLPTEPVSAEKVGQEHEEELRKLMVSYVPRARASKGQAKRVDRLLQSAAALVVPAYSDDLRYLDALNVAYEALRECEKFQGASCKQFLREYLKVLGVHVSRLGAEP